MGRLVVGDVVYRRRSLVGDVPMAGREASVVIGSLFTGYGGLDCAARAALGCDVAWHSEIEPAACRLLEHHHPEVPNLGDITQIDWADVQPVDILTMGFPCQDISAAGRRAGIRPGTRSGLWSHGAYAIAQLRPALVVIENVRGLLSADAHCDLEPCPWCLGDNEGRPLRALGAVLGDLAQLGYDARWHGLRAADVGAPHGRFRVFIVAWPAAHTVGIGCGAEGRDDRLRTEGLESIPAPNSDSVGPVRDGGPRGRRGGPANDDLAAADADRDAVREQPVALTGSGGPAVAGQPVHEGAVTDASSAQARSGEALRDLRELHGAEAVQRTTRGSGGLPAASSLLSELREHAQGRREGHSALASPPAEGRGLHGLRHDGTTPRAPQGPESGKQHLEQPGHPVRELPPETALARGQGAADGGIAWGAYEPAIRRWEGILGRVAPPPTVVGRKGGQQLSPAFVEFLMGLPVGHVTAVPGLSRNEQLKLLGNGVVPQQAEAALRHLLVVDLAGAA